MCAGSDHRGIDLIHDLAYLGGTAGGDFFDFLYGMLLVSGIDPLGTVAGKEIDVVFQSAHAFHDGHALIFCNTGLDGGFIHHDITFGDDLTHCFTGAV